MKAVALFSGGLDSFLATKLILEQGIEVVALYFFSPFCAKETEEQEGILKKMAETLGISFRSEFLDEEYLFLVKNPKYGYGKNLNPCIDCKIFMLKWAKKIMGQIGARFVITGEVLGQRPMSQNKQVLQLSEREGGLGGLLLRPLSAKLLPPTSCESKGWVKRDDLLNISGRSRKVQIALVNKFGIKEYLQPAGGCLLTDAQFCRKLKDLFKHNEYTLSNVELLKLGRHFRLSPKFKLVVGRNEGENKKLLKLAKNKDLYFEPEDLAGPVGIGRGIIDEDTKKLSASVIARYTSLNEEVKIVSGIIGEEKKEGISAKVMNEEFVKKLMI